jgi:hypothetical protein
VFAFRSRTAFLHRMRPPRKPRHPLVRIALGLLGLGVLAVLVFFSVFVGTAMLGAGLLWRLWRVWRQRHQPLAHRPRVLHGQFRTVQRPVLPSA